MHSEEQLQGHAVILPPLNHQLPLFSGTFFWLFLKEKEGAPCLWDLVQKEAVAWGNGWSREDAVCC